MKIQEAKELLERHNEWRRGAGVESENPRKIGVAIDTLIAFTEKVLGEPSEKVLNDQWDTSGIPIPDASITFKAMINEIKKEVEGGEAS